MEEIKIDFEQIEKTYVGVSYYLQSLQEKMNLMESEILKVNAQGWEGMDKDKFIQFWSWLNKDGSNSIYDKLINKLKEYQKNLRKARQLYIETQNLAYQKAYEI